MTEEKKISEYLEVLSSKAPVPGGGGASALAGALGNALGQMVVNLTVGKKKYAEVEEEMQKYLTDLKNMQQEFLHFSDRDAEVFAPLAECYRLHPPPGRKRAQRCRYGRKAVRCQHGSSRDHGKIPGTLRNFRRPGR